MSSLLSIFISIGIAHAFDVPCTQKLIGNKCLFDEECYGMNAVCRNGRCTCPTNFEEFDIDDRTTICRLGMSVLYMKLHSILYIYTFFSRVNFPSTDFRLNNLLQPPSIDRRRPCQRDCKPPPLLCRDGRCECWGGSIVNGECVVPCPAGQQLYGVECTRVAHYGQVCEKDSQCVDPFNACVAGTCQCAPGTTRDVMRGFCYAGKPFR
ncbi:hypothetical protein COOONC_03772 [Cooperia oncophora]